jgi:hypothetical protein
MIGVVENAPPDSNFCLSGQIPLHIWHSLSIVTQAIAQLLILPSGLRGNMSLDSMGISSGSDCETGVAFFLVVAMSGLLVQSLPMDALIAL